MRKDPEVRVSSAPGRAKGTSDSPFLLIHLPELGTRHGNTSGTITKTYLDAS